MSFLFDPIRKKWVEATPEEKVRQAVLHTMLHELGYPSSYIVIEKTLSQLPHLEGQVALASRRADILCFGKNIHPHQTLFPLLLIECKQKIFPKESFAQVVGYNEWVQAPFFALADEKDLQTYWFNSSEKSYQNIKGLPSYEELLQKIENKTSFS